MSAKCLAILSLIVAASLTGNARLGAQVGEGNAAEGDIPTAPVELDGTTLFLVRGVSSLTAGERARLIYERLHTVADASVAVESLRILDSDPMTRILAGDMPLMTVVDADANLEQVPRVSLATAHLARLKQAIIEYRAARSPGALKRAAVNSLAATIVMGAAIVALLMFWRWIDGRAMRRVHDRIQSVHIQSLELIRGERIWSALRSVLFVLRTLAFMALALAYVDFLLAQFPWTRGFSQNMGAFVLQPLGLMGNGIVTNIPKLVFLTVLFVVVRVGLRLVRMFFDAVGWGTVKFAGFEPEWAEPTYKIVRIAIVAFALVVAYPYIPGGDTDAFKGVSLFIGIVFSLGSSSAISNLIAGYMLTYRRALKVGQRIKIGDAFGDVIQTRLGATHLRSIKNEEIIIPNSEIISTEVVNYSSLAQADGLILHTEVRIGYDVAWRQVEALLLTAADRTEGLSREPRPFVLEKALGDFAVTYELNAYCNNVQAMVGLYAELHRNVLDVFNEHGVQIMVPAYEGDPAEPKIVQRKDWYTTPPATSV